MRNLKRALSLAVASVMLLGMMVVGSSASYADVDASDNLEAIEVLQLVGIMAGDENGNFNPDKIVSRNEMAVVMCNLLGVNPSGTSPFTDVPEWAQGYVNVCYNYGIVGGYSSTIYGGSDPVTTAQAALMVMKTLGYFEYGGEFGDDWQLATVKQANRIALFDGIDAGVTEGLTRNNVAKLVLNALESDVIVVKEYGGLSVEGNGITVKENPTYSYLDTYTIENYKGPQLAAPSTQQLAEKLYGSKLQKNHDTTDEFGRPSTQWTYNTETVTSPKAATLTYTEEVKVKDIYSDLGKPSVYFLEDSLGYDNKINVDGQSGQNSNNGTAITDPKNNDLKVGGNGAVTEVYFDNTTGEANIVVINTYLISAAADYNANDDELAVNPYGITLKDSKLSGKDFAISGYEKDDYILVTGTIANGELTVKSIAPATVVENVLASAYKSGDSVTAGGVTYKYSAQADRVTFANISGTYSLQNTGYDFILDSYGYVIGVKPHSDEASLEDILFVKEAAKSGFDYLAKVVFMDGTSKTVTVAGTQKADGTEVKGVDEVLNDGTPLTADGKLSALRFYEFSVNKNGEYELTESANQNVATGAIKNGTATPIENVSYAANNSTVVIAKNTAYVGVKNVPNVSSSDVYYLLDSNSSYILAAYTGTAGTVSTDASEFVFVFAGPQTAKDTDGNEYYIYDAVKDGVKITLNAQKGNDENQLRKIGSYTDGYADLSSVAGDSQVNAQTGVVNTAISSKGGTLVIGGQSYILADNAAIYVIDKGDKKVSAVSATALGTLSAGSYDTYAIEVSTTDSDIAIVYLVK